MSVIALVGCTVCLVDSVQEAVELSAGMEEVICEELKGNYCFAREDRKITFDESEEYEDELESLDKAWYVSFNNDGEAKEAYELFLNEESYELQDDSQNMDGSYTHSTIHIILEEDFDELYECATSY